MSRSLLAAFLRNLSRGLAGSLTVLAAAEAISGPPMVLTGDPAVSFRDGVELELEWDGARPAVEALHAGRAEPLSLASADLDEDGTLDLLAGYRAAVGGVLAVHQGNVEA